MAVKATVLFDQPQSEIASLIREKLTQSSRTSIVTGFVTPGGVDVIRGPISASPGSVNAIVVGAATYPGFEALDGLLALGVPRNCLYIHLGHTRYTGGRKNPFARYHPMLHSKIYCMEFPDGDACAFIGSHNVTSFALRGLNGEASVLLEGPASATEFEQIRTHIETVRIQAVPYSPAMKEAFAWWTREFLDGMRVELGVPQSSIAGRTLLIFATAENRQRPKPGDQLYFEIPAGIEEIVSLKTEAHLFLFDSLPATPLEAVDRASTADASFICKTLGADNRQGNREVVADWHIDGTRAPVLKPVSGGILRPTTSKAMQQVRAEVSAVPVSPCEYLFEREKTGWEPVLSDNPTLYPSGPTRGQIDFDGKLMGSPAAEGWSLVTGLVPREGTGWERDAAALQLAAPESGSFILVSLRRRRKESARRED